MSYSFSPQIVKGTLTSAQIKALHGTPITVIAAPPSGNAIILLNAYLAFKYGGSNVFVAGAGQTIVPYYSNLTQTTGITLANAVLTGTSSKFQLNTMPTLTSTLISAIDGLAMTLYNSVATEITGNAANDNTVDYAISYFIAPT